MKIISMGCKSIFLTLILKSVVERGIGAGKKVPKFAAMVVLSIVLLFYCYCHWLLLLFGQEEMGRMISTIQRIIKK